MKIELEVLADKLQQLEYKLLVDWGLRRISGGFVHLSYVSHDDKYIYLTCRSGVQNDVDNDVEEEEMRMDCNYNLI